MATFLLLVFAGGAFYLMTPDERRRLFLAVVQGARRVVDSAALFRLDRRDPFSIAIRERTRWPLVTGLLLLVNVAVFVAVVMDTGALSDPDTLVAWGGSIGPRTTNGERWRLLTAIFVHGGILHLLVNMAALAQLGRIVERVAGPLTFAVVYVAAGVLAIVRTLAISPMSVSAGADGAVFGIYGLLVAVSLRGALQQSAITIPMRAGRMLAPVTVAFLLYSVLSERTYLVANVGLCTGFVGGVVLTRSVGDRFVRLRRLTALSTATTAIVLMAAMSVGVVADVRPGISAVVATEERTAGLYDEALVRYRAGGMPISELATLIERAIVPDLEESGRRVSALTDVPAEHETLLRDTGEYLRLRQESWRLRALALRSASMPRLREADALERASLQVFDGVKAAVEQSR